MSVAVIKAITRRIRLRYGSAELAAAGAGLANKGAWSLYESDEHPETTIPIHRFLSVANAAEKAAMAALFRGGDMDPPACLNTEAGETTETAAELQKMARLATEDGKITPLEARALTRKALEVQAQAADVIASVGGR